MKGWIRRYTLDNKLQETETVTVKVKDVTVKTIDNLRNLGEQVKKCNEVSTKQSCWRHPFRPSTLMWMKNLNHHIDNFYPS